MEQRRKCKEINDMVIARCEPKEIKDGNSNYPAGIKYIPIDCLNKECKKYKGCKITKFDNIQ